MHWRVKGVVQRVLSAVPGGMSLNDRLQQSLGDLRNLRGNVESRVVRDWLVLVENMTGLSVNVQGRRFFEVGTGWMPVLPICFSLGGAASCTTIDLTRHMNAALTFRMLALLEPYLTRIASATSRPLAQVQADYLAMRNAATLEALLERARIRYLSPADARATGLANGSMDVVFSNNVFEHVPHEVLRGIFRESHRILCDGGWAIHSVNCADHYAYFDRNITFINYLTYPEHQWRFWNSPLQYQNRLRPSDFVDLAVDAGFDVRLRKVRVREELRATLSVMALAPEFRKYDEDELCSTSLLLGTVRVAAAAS